MRLVLPNPHRVHCFVCLLSDMLPQRLHETCVLLFLFPIEGVPFDISVTPEVLYFDYDFPIIIIRTYEYGIYKISYNLPITVRHIRHYLP